MKKNKFYTAFGRTLAKLRNQRNLTQEQLAEYAGLSVDFLSLIERGQRAPSFKTLERLTIVLQVKARDLFDFDNHQ